MNRYVNYVFLMFLACFGLLSSCSDGDSERESINNEYELDGEVFDITTTMSWVEGDKDVGEHLSLREPIPDSDLHDLIILTPKSSSSSFEGIYVYSKTGDVGTYNLEFAHAVNDQGEWQWFTNGDGGDRLEIEFVGTLEGEDIYKVTLSGFTLNYGYWDYLAGKWVSFGQKPFRLTYEGVILR